MGATRCETGLRSRFTGRRSMLRRMLFAAVASWSLSTAACVPYARRYDAPEPTPAPLAARDSLAHAYDLGMQDGKATLTHPSTSVVRALTAVVFLGGVVLTAVTKNLLMLVYTGLAGAAGLTVVTVQKSHQPTAVPDDSVRSACGLRSAAMWDNYVNGYQDVINTHRDADVRSGYAASAAIVIASGIIFLVFTVIKSVFKHIS